MSTATGPSLSREEDLERVIFRATLTESTIEHAIARWQRVRAAIVSGAERDGRAEGLHTNRIRERYVSIKRLTDEARRVIHAQAAPDAIRTLYAIDPHLIRGYCTYWDDSNFLSFDFFRREWEPGEGQERTEFIVYQLGSILRLQNLICLEAGRQEIGDMLAFFMNSSPRAEAHQQQSDDLAQAIRDISKTGDETAEALDPANVQGFILRKFEALVAAGGIPLMRNLLADSRLRQILNDRRLHQSFQALRNAVPGEADAIHRAEDLFRRYTHDDELLRVGRSSLHRAYRAYSPLSRFTSGGLVSELDAPLRSGEQTNLNALFELHLINTCLSVVGVNARVKYITTSTVIANFLSAFPGDGLSVEIVHPRHVFMFEKQPTPDNFARFQQVISSPGAFLRAMTTDETIREGELDQFEARYATTIRLMRQTYSFDNIETDVAKNAYIQAIVDFADNHAGPRRDEILSYVPTIAEKLSDASSQVLAGFDSAAPQRLDDGFRAYREFSQSIRPAIGATKVLVRAFGVEPTGELSGSVPRLVCIPARGGFRNIFKIYHTSVIDALHKSYRHRTRAVQVAGLLDAVEGAVREQPEVSPPKQLWDETSALQAFTRAIYSAAEREWTLALSYTQLAMNDLGFADPLQMTGVLADRVPGNTPEGRRRLMGQEAMILAHFAKRGIASNLENLSRRRRWLKLAAEDLHASATLTLSVEDRESFETPYNPNSVREALACVALLTEWIALKNARLGAGRRNSIDTERTILLPLSEDPTVVWRDLKCAGRTLQSYWEPRDEVADLLHDIDVLCARVQETCNLLNAEDESARAQAQAANVDPPPPPHSAEFWRYILIKAQSLRLLLGLSIELRVFETETVSPVTSADLDAFRSLIEAHGAFVLATEVDTAGNGVLPWESAADREALHNPFANFLLHATSFLKTPPPAGVAKMVRDISWVREVLTVAQFHHSLGESGFPRSISQRFLSRYGAEAVDKLHYITEALARDARLSDPYAGELD